MQSTTRAPPANDTESGSNAESHQTQALPPGCPWRLETVRAVLRGTHDAQSPLHQLQAQHCLLELIIRRWVWPELFLDALIAEMLEPNLIRQLVDESPRAELTHLDASHRSSQCLALEAKLRERLYLNPDGSICRWDLSHCGLWVLPELFGAVCTTGHLWLHGNQLRLLPDSFGSIKVGGHLWLHGNQLRLLPDSFGSIKVGGDLWLDNNQLSSLPDSFGSITVGGSLLLTNNQLSSLPDSFGSITVGRHLYLENNQLDKQTIPTKFPNVRGEIDIIDSESLSSTSSSTIGIYFPNVGGECSSSNTTESDSNSDSDTSDTTSSIN